MGTLDYRIYNDRLLDCVANYLVWEEADIFEKKEILLYVRLFYITNFVSICHLDIEKITVHL